jgi:hypothetical protein
VNQQVAVSRQRIANTPKIDELLKAVFSVGSAPRLYNEDPMPAEGFNKSLARVAGHEGHERGKLKNFHCYKPLQRNGCL